ncbi:carboxyl transferase domain-containing protein [Ruicaihuangia caeni]|uniref:Carboxyl transferase domain-containing protein n=1 Tax=Ruicaihuangia caeni TaxID=3042517 RepID=A0AAW6T779_9MICO|nr:carboxyl transferase domain-containing protein [Klugiella sp. YN-L-19]MDI2099084.1 carboxyl transferase domain-containing protein [Klugiella sp. YN-L-19]
MSGVDAAPDLTVIEADAYAPLVTGERARAGTCTLDGRRAVVYVVDGALASDADAIVVERAASLAANAGLPLVGLWLASAAVRAAAPSAISRALAAVARARGVVPRLAVSLGDTDEWRDVFLAQAERVVHAVDAVDDGVLDTVLETLAILPPNRWQGVARLEPLEASTPEQRDAVLEVVPKDIGSGFDMRELLELIVDDGEFVNRDVAPLELIVGHARFGGRTAGVIASQPLYRAGILSRDAADTAARFLRECVSLGLPVVTIVDSPGTGGGEVAAAAAELAAVYSDADVPFITVIPRRAFGLPAAVMGALGLGAQAVLAWPDSQIGRPGEAPSERTTTAVIQPQATAESIAGFLDMFADGIRESQS